ncbi:MAG: nucleoside deaminase [Ignavibacterium sp.]|nr:nucleoside deaminase [Ignavibacterium sp.]
MREDIFYINRCKTLAKSAAEKGNSPVGAIIVKDDKIISEAEEAVKNKNDVTCHAEIEAVRIAVKKLNSTNLSECILYTTHEPCIMCSYAIRYYKIKKIIFLNTVDYLGGATSSMALLRSDLVPPDWGKSPEIVQLKSDI